jgi:hypothetical protein
MPEQCRHHALHRIGALVIGCWAFISVPTFLAMTGLWSWPTQGDAQPPGSLEGRIAAIAGAAGFGLFLASAVAMLLSPVIWVYRCPMTKRAQHREEPSQSALS